MIVKEFSIPVIILCLEAIFRRLPKGHPLKLKIEEELTYYRSGYSGEKSMTYYLNLLKDSRYYILRGIRLNNDIGLFYQMDILLLSPFFIHIIEVKNHSGTIYFDKHFNQMIRISGGSEKRFANPLAQVNRQLLQYKHWVKKNGFPIMPIETTVVMSHPKVILKTDPENKHILTKVILAENFLDRIQELEEKHHRCMIDTECVNKMSTKLIKDHNPWQPDPLALYGLAGKDIIGGVICPECGRIPMDREFRNWVCPRCQATSKNAHEQAIMDYLLIHGTITNQQCCDFLSISSRNIAYKLLKSMNLPFTGSGKGRVYHLPHPKSKWWESFS
ncbi:nuclease-like protein [Scopulibacillus darangshiensis]|uniref:Nuclease-like protein n=1 Tax=Scopulibacillus darangshiensis TaxID=442528 RepID=A0A4R2PAM5_9BACL|nr:nuclease-related domain-containing protein [Scopulibacillus darangshiensis]TCP31334.1 nuclease-like protein [Scopulibacillus darangshiensis]